MSKGNRDRTSNHQAYWGCPLWEKDEDSEPMTSYPGILDEPGVFVAKLDWAVKMTDPKDSPARNKRQQNCLPSLPTTIPPRWRKEQQ